MATTPPSRATLEFIGTATTLLHMGPFTLLTDPNFLHKGQFAYLGRARPSRGMAHASPRQDFVDRFAREGLPSELRLVDRGQTVPLL